MSKSWYTIHTDGGIDYSPYWGFIIKNPDHTEFLRSDSQYLIYTFTQNWKRRANHDLWNLLEDAIRNHQAVSLNWIPREQNQECDRLARNSKLPPINEATK